MSSVTVVTFRGWKAVAVLVAVAAFTVLRVGSARSSLDTQGREELETWIRAEVTSDILADSTAGLTERGEALVGASRVVIRSLEARGPLDDTVVKVELEPNPHFPEGTELVRYYRLAYSAILGWSYKGDANVVSWYLALI